MKTSINTIIEKLDDLLNNCKLDEAEIYIEEQIYLALSDNRNDDAIALYNEQIGYFRDCGKFDNAVESCKRVLELIKNCNYENTPFHATTLLNIANAYRACGRFEESFSSYETVKNIYDMNPETDSTLYASYYNNISLLYQETGNYEMACECQKKALEIVANTDDVQKIAISKTNLAVSYIRLGKIDEAENLVKDAMKCFCGLSPSDFHYSAALSAMGDIEFYRNKYDSAAEYYEMALAETELHMGRNNFFDIISENMKLAKEKGGISSDINGMELCRKYYECFGKPVIERNFPEFKDRIVCGMVGEGSDCFGFDDEFSRDHDFGPSFCIWLDDDIFEKIGDKLQKAYDLLPKYFMGFERNKSIQSKKRTGVFSSVKFYSELLENRIPESVSDWLNIPIEKLAAAVNGEVFTDTENDFIHIRTKLKKGMPYAAKLKHIAQQTALMCQSGQYNLIRCVKRGDEVTALICLGDFTQSTLRCLKLLDNKYYPHYKWLYKSCDYAEIKNLLTKYKSVPTEKWYDEIVAPVCEFVRNKLMVKFEIMSEKDYLDNIAWELSNMADERMKKEKLAFEIAKMEFEAFDKVKNEGGRVNCQDDWNTFSIMRMSQYLTWDIPMLEQYIFDFREALKIGRNMITEKYARMMMSTSPEKYAEIESQLPELEEDSVRICDSICSIQVEWMEEFCKEFPNLSMQTRRIHTYEDTEWDTSYETYLRGELLTYSRAMLRMYAGFIVKLSHNNKNLAYLTMQYTAEFYGYKTLEDAENGCR